MKIKDFIQNTPIQLPLLISNVSQGVTQNGAPYLSFLFQDSSGQIEGKWWDVPKEALESAEIGKIGFVNADVLLYRGALQLRVKGIDYSQSFDLAEFAVASEYDSEFLKTKIASYIDMIENPVYSALVKACFEHYGDSFYEYPAATRNHHDFVGGLATHVYTMCQSAVHLKAVYPLLNLDLLLAGILVHDMGKIEEYTRALLSEYSTEGKLLGHISIMQAQLFSISQALGLEHTEESMLLRHLVLAHHGLMEYGSPVRPLVVEAEILHFIDNIDARMNMFDKLMDNLDEGEFSPRTFSLENRSFYKPKGE